jgi:hypothetical protein
MSNKYFEPNKFSQANNYFEPNKYLEELKSKHIWIEEDEKSEENINRIYKGFTYEKENKFTWCPFKNPEMYKKRCYIWQKEIGKKPGLIGIFTTGEKIVEYYDILENSNKF